MTDQDDKLVEVKLEYEWIPGIESHCEAEYKKCGFQQFFNEDRASEVSTFLYWNEVVALHKQLQAILDGYPINTTQWPKDSDQQSLKEFEE